MFTYATVVSAAVDAIVQHGEKRRAGGILPPQNRETMLIKLAEYSPAAKKLVRKLMGDEEDEDIEDIKQGTGNFFNE